MAPPHRRATTTPPMGPVAPRTMCLAVNRWALLVTLVLLIVLGAAGASGAQGILGVPAAAAAETGSTATATGSAATATDSAADWMTIEAATTVKPTPATLVRTVPAVGSILSTAPNRVTLSFDRPLASGKITISGPNGPAGAGTATISGNDLGKALRPGLPPGTYTITWRAKPFEGRVATGRHSFSIDGGPTSSPTSATPDPSTPPTAGSGSTAAPSATGGAPGSTDPAALTGAPTGGTDDDAVAGGGNRSGSLSHSRAGGGTPGAGGPSTTGKAAPAATSSGSNAVKAFAAESRTFGAWLIGLAVLIQAAAGIWGLWRSRQVEGAAKLQSATDARPADDQEDDAELWVEDLRLSAALANRPWTGELPVRRDDDPPAPITPVPPRQSTDT